MRDLIHSVPACWPNNVSKDIPCDDEGFVLGADTSLVRRTADGRFAVEARCLALLSVAGRRAVGASILASLEAAATHWAAGDKALANLRLVFAGLPRLVEPADLYRLQAAAYCLDEGLAPRDLMKTLDLDPSVLDLTKFDQNQPRVPAGNGRESGQWIGSNGLISSPSLPVPHVLLAATTRNFDYACKALGLNPHAASDALHAAKRAADLGGADNCVFDLDTGDIFFNGELSAILENRSGATFRLSHRHEFTTPEQRPASARPCDTFECKCEAFTL